MEDIIDEPYFQGSTTPFPIDNLPKKIEGISIEEKCSTRVLTFKGACTVKQMVPLEDTLEEWEKDDGIGLIILKTAQNHLSARRDDGRMSIELEKSIQTGEEHFYRAHWLNYHIATYRKPLIAFWNGFFSATSASLPMMCTYSIVTEKTVFTFSEAGVGFHTDIGVSHLLSRLPGHLGEYLALTGASLNGAELLASGLATHYLPSKSLWRLENLLLALDSGEPEQLSSILEELSMVVEPPEDSILNRLNVISTCFSKNSVEAILEAIVFEGTRNSSDSYWLQNVYSSLQRSSPTGLKQTLQSIREARHKTLIDCMRQEYRLTVNALKSTISTDLWEAIRVTHKDAIPKWSPATLVEVTEDKLHLLFQPLGLEEIQLPAEGDRPRWSGKFKSMIRHRM